MIRPQIKPQRLKDEAVLDFIRGRECIGLYLLSAPDARQHTHHCTYFRTKRSEANHIRRGVQTGMRTKPNDVRVLPFCTSLHQEYTSLGHKRFCEKYGLTLEQFEREMGRLISEYRKLHKLQIAIVKSKPRLYLHVVNCSACGQTHDIAISKLNKKRTPWTFQCTFKQEWIEVA